MPQDTIQWWADLSSILTFVITTVTALIGLGGYFHYLNDRRRKQQRLEEYLKDEKANTKGGGQRSLINIVRHVGLTEDEIISLSFRSQHIERRIKSDATGFADRLLFEYMDLKDERN